MKQKIADRPSSYLFLNIVFFLFVCLASNVSAAPGQPPPNKLEKSGTELEYKIGLGDVIEVQVWKEPDLTRTLSVRLDGRISLPLIGDVMAAGKSPKELTEELDKKFRQVIEEPAVAVILTQSNSQRYYIIGQIAHPGEFPINYPVTVLQAIARAGGFLEWAKTSKISIVRREGEQEKFFAFNYDAFIKGDDLTQNIQIRQGDTIIIP